MTGVSQGVSKEVVVKDIAPGTIAYFRYQDPLKRHIFRSLPVPGKSRKSKSGCLYKERRHDIWVLRKSMRNTGAMFAVMRWW